MYGFFLGTLAKSGNSTEGNGVVLLKRHRWKLPLFWRLLSLCSKPPLNEEGNEEGAREGSGTRRSILDRNLRFRLPSLPIPLQWRPLGNLSIFLFLNVYWISEVVELIELRILNFECRWKWWMTREQWYTEWSNRSWTSFFLLGILTGENRFLCHLQHGTMKRRRLFYLFRVFYVLDFVQRERGVSEIHAVPGSATLFQCGIVCAFNSGLFLIPTKWFGFRNYNWNWYWSRNFL